jgi:hypothetical protein
MMSETLLTAKTAAQEKIAEELLLRLRRCLPRMLTRLKKGAERDTPHGTFSAQLIEVFRSDRNLAAGFLIGQLVEGHFRDFLRTEFYKILRERRSVVIHDCVTELLELAAIAREGYPEGLRPAMPTRRSLANLMVAQLRRRLR